MLAFLAALAATLAASELLVWGFSRLGFKLASGALMKPPPPVESASGGGASMVANAVIKMGRSRRLPPWISASWTSRPRSRYCSTRSRRTMALVTTLPVSISTPTMPGSAYVEDVSEAVAKLERPPVLVGASDPSYLDHAARGGTASDATGGIMVHRLRPEERSAASVQPWDAAADQLGARRPSAEGDPAQWGPLTGAVPPQAIPGRP